MSGLDPTPLSEAAAAAHEMFTELVTAGFTEWQTCRIIGVWIAEQGRQS